MRGRSSCCTRRRRGCSGNGRKPWKISIRYWFVRRFSSSVYRQWLEFVNLSDRIFQKYRVYIFIFVTIDIFLPYSFLSYFLPSRGLTDSPANANATCHKFWKLKPNAMLQRKFPNIAIVFATDSENVLDADDWWDSCGLHIPW